jgi:hypothetical protein
VGGKYEVYLFSRIASLNLRFLGYASLGMTIAVGAVGVSYFDWKKVTRWLIAQHAIIF